MHSAVYSWHVFIHRLQTFSLMSRFMFLTVFSLFLERFLFLLLFLWIADHRKLSVGERRSGDDAAGVCGCRADA